MIDVDGVSMSLGDRRVLDDVTVSIDRGEFVGLVGPNGAGKTTLLRTINGLLDPDAGRVTVDGRDVAATSARSVSRLVATVPQETTVAFEFSVRDVVAMGRTPYHSRFGRADHGADRRHVQRALDRTETAQFADRSIDAVSGGERQRVLLARALAQDTPVLLLDEPTASLDVNHQVRTLDAVADLTAEGKTVVAAIHDLDLAARFCDRLVLLSEGDVLADGSPETVLTGSTVSTGFDTEATVATNPITGTPSVTPMRDRPSESLRVHVLAGGSMGASVIGRLHRAGFAVTVGPIPAGDLAAETATTLAESVVTASPFEALDPDAIRDANDLLAGADRVVVADPPVDPTALDVAAADAPVVRVDESNTAADLARTVAAADGTEIPADD